MKKRMLIGRSMNSAAMAASEHKQTDEDDGNYRGNVPVGWMVRCRRYPTSVSTCYTNVEFGPGVGDEGRYGGGSTKTRKANWRTSFTSRVLIFAMTRNTACMCLVDCKYRLESLVVLDQSSWPCLTGGREGGERELGLDDGSISDITGLLQAAAGWPFVQSHGLCTLRMAGF